ncbi:WhiB family transcriptional regulator [Rhodococcus sp. USK10]|uniref:WhiB family transcriptional regulator n=1 Tax=Rhodococcus sp. USK10 TaxID=2789739 RepID=UPI001C5F86E0|nr:WhiB family transcriptional regulator [Rhodococcus sp. USK10]QYB07416.1 WhiB family transcriptional regulator [Rhodococcus sp. USK10]
MPAPIPMNLPAPLTAEWDWQLHARCRATDIGLFFHPDNERGRERSARAKAAKQICARCPVQDRCQAHAIEAGEHYGTWGGLSEDDRKSFRRRPSHVNQVNPRIAG